MDNYQTVPDPYFDNKNKSGSFILKATMLILAIIFLYVGFRYIPKAINKGAMSNEITNKLPRFMSYYSRTSDEFERMEVDIEKYHGNVGSKGDDDIHSYSVGSFKDPMGKMHTNTKMYVYWNRFYGGISYIKVDGEKYGTCLDCLLDENSSYGKQMLKYRREDELKEQGTPVY